MLTASAADEGIPDSAVVNLVTPVTVDPQFGTARTQIPIQVPPSRALTPELAVRYSSNAGNGLFGLGWDLALGCIKRNSAAGVPFDYSRLSHAPGTPVPTPVYDDTRGFVLMLKGGTIDLDVKLGTSESSTSWGASAEEIWLDATFNSVDNSWTVLDREGTRYSFGTVPEARTGRDVSASAETVSWHITRVRDQNGNVVEFAYDASRVGVANPSVYPTQINYGGNFDANGGAIYSHIFHIGFWYPNSARPDIVTTYTEGFAQNIDRVVSAISVWTDGSPASTCGSPGKACPTRKYLFSYVQDADTGVSLLSGVRLEPKAAPTEADEVTDGPPEATFEYYSSSRRFGSPINLTFDSAAPSPKSLGEYQSLGSSTPSDVVSGFLDLNGDGLVDFLNADASGLTRRDALTVNSYGLYFGGGQHWTNLTNKLASQSKRLVDMNGDVFRDLLEASSTGWRVRLSNGGVLGEAAPWPGVPTALWNTTFPFPYSNPAAQLIDLDGDARPDLLDCTNWQDPTYVCQFRRNTATGFAEGVDWSVPPSSPPANLLTPLYADLHPDGPGGYLAHWEQCPPEDGVFQPGVLGSTLIDVRKKLVDMNGDGLPDLVTWWPLPHWDIFLNTGSGFGGPQQWPTGHDTPIERYCFHVDDLALPEQAGYHQVRGLRELNGDGLIDYLETMYTDPAADWKIYLNSGVGFEPSTGVGQPPWVGARGGGLEHYGIWPWNSAEARRTSHPWYFGVDSLFDINGDMAADKVYLSTTSSQLLPYSYPQFFSTYPPINYYAQLAQGPHSGLLKSQANGLGARWDITYAFLSDPGGDCPFGTWAVDKLTEVSDFGTERSSFYSFAQGYFDHAQHKFRGFRSSQEWRLPGLISQRPAEWYDQKGVKRTFAPPPFSGTPESGTLPSRPFRLATEEIVGSHFGTEEMVGQHSTEIHWGAVTKSNGIQVQVRPIQRVETEFGSQGLSQKTKTVTFNSYDNYNSLTSETVSGDGVSLTTKTDYSTSCHHRATKITACSGTDPICGNGTVLSASEFTYDSRCNPRRFLGRLASPGESVLSESLIPTGELVYDPNVDSQAAAAGHPTRIIDARGYPTTVSYSCDSSHGVFPCTITNPLQHVTSHTYALEFGAVKSTTDPNGQITQITYDGIGRPTTVVRPLVEANKAWRKFDYVFGEPGGEPSRIETQIREPSHALSYRTEVEFIDDLGRHLATKKENAVEGSNESTIVDQVVYDAYGRVALRLVPRSGTSDLSAFQPAQGDEAKSLILYDKFDRIVEVHKPDDTMQVTSYDPAGVVETWDENYVECHPQQGQPGPNASCPGKKTVQVHDALGRLVTDSKYEGSVLVTRTVNEYDELDRLKLTRTEDNSGSNGHSTITFAYDSFGRQVTMTDPDSGTWQYGYDESGNKVFEDDPKSGQHIETCYDQLDRVTRKSKLTGDSFTDLACSASGNLAIYQYDCAANGKGRLCHGIGPDGAVVTDITGYDIRGNVQSMVRTINAGGVSRQLQSQYTYDLADRLYRVLVPTDVAGTYENLTYYHNFAGQLVAASTGGNSYLQSITYDRFGRRTKQQYGDGTLDQWIYSTNPQDNFHLIGIKVSRGSTTLQNFVYGPYDYDGNLLKVTDSTPSAQYAQGSSRDSDWDYTYDGIGRLKSAKWGSVPTTASFEYDYLGNMNVGNLSFPSLTTATTLTFTRDTQRPHHIATLTPHTGSIPIEYQSGGTNGDGNGGLQSRPQTPGADLGKQLVEYNIEGKVTRVTLSDGTTVDSIYDHAGNRAARVVNGNDVTMYFNPYVQLRGSTLTRNVIAAGGVIAQSTLNAPAGLSLAQGRANTESMFAAVSDAARDTSCGRFSLLASLFVRPACASCDPSTPPTSYPTFYLHKDYLGSTTLLTTQLISGSADGSVAQYYRYGPYGRVKGYSASGGAVNPGTETTDILFTGQRWDSSSQLYYFGARFYDPAVARFLTRDPVRDFWNPYAYVQWNPLRRIDPSGMQGIEIGSPPLGFDLPSFSQFGNFSPLQDGLRAKVSYAKGVAGQRWDEFDSLAKPILDQFHASVDQWVRDMKARGYPGAASVQGLTNLLPHTTGQAIFVGATLGAAATMRLAAIGAGVDAEIGAAERAIATEYGPAVQATTSEAQAALRQVQSGAILYKGGVLGRSETGASQFLALKNPLSPGFAAEYGIPEENASFNFVLTGKLQSGADVITRHAPGIPPNSGGGIEAVTTPGSFSIDSFYMP
jgi:RHS repeat-associated protein